MLASWFDNRRMPKLTHHHVRAFLLEQLTKRTAVDVKSVMDRFDFTRQAASHHLRKLVENREIVERQFGRRKRYSIESTRAAKFEGKLARLEEDRVWLSHFAPKLADLPANVVNIWHYGFTKILNNAVEHSGGTAVRVEMSRNAAYSELSIHDDGEGIFRHIQRLLGLYDAREVLLELTKGKLTTDPKGHTGEGIFFSSKAFDVFEIHAGEHAFSHLTEEDDYQFDSAEKTTGTRVVMRLRNSASTLLKEVFDAFAAPDEFSFDRTVVPVKLAKHEGESLVSRSQAKRLSMRFEKFSTVVLDFAGVSHVGQAFADELFRVFANEHPNTQLVPLHANADIQAMIHRALRHKT